MKNTDSLTKLFLASLLTSVGVAALACPDARATSVISVVHNFAASNGDVAFQGMIKASDGNFYGTTTAGGPDDAGVIYKLTPAGVYSVLHAFHDDTENENSPLEGVEPGPIIQAKDGDLYGVCLGGGKNPNTPNGGGTFFKLTLKGVFTKLYDFDTGKSTAADFPVACVEGGDGNFYGLSRTNGEDGDGDGCYWRLSPDGKTYKQLFAFTDPDHGGAGYSPMAQLLVASDGNFYGTTTAGASSPSGDSGNGTIFKATTAGKVTVVHAFTGDPDESDSPPMPLDTALIQGTDGNLYGVSTYGGKADEGTIFQCTLAGKVTLLHNFAAGSDGAEPEGALVQGSDGNFYGGLRAGFPGEDGPGGLYQVTPAGVYTVLHKFSTTTKTGPIQSFGNLVEVTKGVFYGVTAGGSQQGGTIIKMTVSPAITSAATATATQGQPFSYQIKATNDPASYACTGRPAGLNVDTATGLISGTTEATGVRTLTLQAKNAGGTGTKTLTLTINKAK